VEIRPSVSTTRILVQKCHSSSLPLKGDRKLVVSKTDLQASTDKGIMLDSGVGRIVSPKAAEGNLEDAPNPSR